MQINTTKKQAMTLFEIGLVFLIIGIVAMVINNIARVKSTIALNGHMTYSGVTNFKEGVGNLIAEGCTSDDVTAGYCANTYTLPIVAHNAESRGFCDRISELFNTIGTPDCTLTSVNDSTDFNAATPNFITNNGMRFFNLGTNPTGVSPNILYTMYVDIDGSKRNGALDEDIIKLTINTNGQILPAKDTKAAEDTNYLSASVRYVDETNDYRYTWLDDAQNISYRQAACTAGIVTDATYCTGYSQSDTCIPSAGCEVVINKP